MRSCRRQMVETEGSSDHGEMLIWSGRATPDQAPGSTCSSAARIEVEVDRGEHRICDVNWRMASSHSY